MLLPVAAKTVTTMANHMDAGCVFQHQGLRASLHAVNVKYVSPPGSCSLMVSNKCLMLHRLQLPNAALRKSSFFRFLFL